MSEDLIICEKCQGNGIGGIFEKVCRTCKGEGKVSSLLIECPDCDGCGLYHYNFWHETCDTCEGTGLTTPENADKYNKKIEESTKDRELKERVYEFIDKIKDLEDENNSLKFRNNVYVFLLLTTIILRLLSIG